MGKDQIKEQLKSIFRQVAPEIEFSKIDLQRSLFEQREIEIDSFDFYNIITKLEKETTIRLPGKVLRETPHLNALIDYIDKEQVAAKPPHC